MESIRVFFRNKSGVTSMEYGIIAGLLAVGLVAALGLFYENLAALFGSWAAWFAAPSTKAPF